MTNPSRIARYIDMKKGSKKVKTEPIELIKVKSETDNQIRPRPVGRKEFDGKILVGYPYQGGILYVPDFKTFDRTRKNRRKLERARAKKSNWSRGPNG